MKTPKLPWAWIALFVVGSGCVPKAQLEPAAPPGTPQAEAEAEAHFKRGMNLGNALEAPQEGAWGVRLSPAHFSSYARAGFDHVRLPVRFNAHAGDSAPYPLDETFMQRVDWAIAQARKNHLTIILDFHNYDELHAQPAAHADRFVGLWVQIAARYKSQPRTVMLELLNEPHGELTSSVWNPIAARALAAIRAVDPTRLVVVDGVSWANANKLEELVLPGDDQNLIASFHMYEPHLFTHQGMTAWNPPAWGTTGIVYPGPPPTPIQPVAAAQQLDWAARWFREYNTLPADQNPCGPKTIREQFDYATRYRQRTSLPIYMGEFGAADSVDPASRARWLRAVREEADRRGIGWAYWDDGAHFKLFDVASQSFNPELRAALLGE